MGAGFPGLAFRGPPVIEALTRYDAHLTLMVRDSFAMGDDRGSPTQQLDLKPKDRSPMNAGPVQLPGVPFELVWALAPEHWEPVVGSASRESGVLIEAGPLSDLFASPDDLEPSLNAPRLIGVPDSRFQLSALVDVEFASTFDAGVLLVWANERSWAKLCLEHSPAGQPMVVSVVTRGLSDDANSRDVEGSGTWLRISRSTPGSFAFHAATDGVHWSLIRHFSLDLAPDDVVRIGFLAQSPTGEGCRASFSQLRYLPEALDDLRGGD